VEKRPDFTVIYKADEKRGSLYGSPLLVERKNMLEYNGNRDEFYVNNKDTE